MTAPYLNQEKILAHNFCAGEWVSPSGEEILVTSPYTGQEIGRTHHSTPKDIDSILKAAEVGFQTWQACTMKERAQVLFNFRQQMLDHLGEMSQMVSLENGKTVEEAKAGILKGVEVLEFALSLQNSDLGGKMEVSRQVFCEYRRFPLGVVLGITPFNFPAMVPMWMIPIALALGNSFVLKPSEKTPLTAIWLANLLKKSGLPDGAFSVVQGGAQSTKYLLEHPSIKAIGFVGSTPVAKLVYEGAARHGKQVLSLGGAKNHIILLPDANPELTPTGIRDSFTGCGGQRCMAASVLLAVGDVEKLIEDIVRSCSKLSLGNSMGAVISQEQVTFLKQAVDEAVKSGANLLLDGRNPKLNPPFDEGFWFGPTILDNVKPGSKAAVTELFGPILSIIRCQNLDEAIEIERSIPFGNAVSVFTNDPISVEKIVNQTTSAMVGVNVGVPVPREPFSFGGMGDSKFGSGEITGTHSLNLWSQMKKITTKWTPVEHKNWMN